ncbi:MAG: hypothetical protein DI598_03155 [Pseudopedobacter saltans]|uniref:Outer membrane protein beta-barrel domain-containing protein n=1 Tax=Pseudopedobacter saltans TaxID=151895 RepID=A0A2W5FCT2_9SPHI|nr:MAG: hypothetical protein DI598_03155 [Pseudopedobacter saltans]
MKKIMFSLTIVLIALSSHAQKDAGIAIGADVALPIGDFKTITSFGYGAHGEYYKTFADKIVGFGQLAVRRFNGKKVSFSEDIEGYDMEDYKYPSQTLVNGIVGARYKLSNEFQVGLGIGYGSLSGGGESNGGFMLQPALVYDLEKFNISLSYNRLSNNGSIAFMNLGFSFKL